MAFFQSFLDLGPTIVLPVLVTIFALILGAGLSRSIKSGITVGVGFIGINLVVGLLGGNLGPAAQQMVENFNLSLNTIDVGWPASAAIAFGSKLGGLAIPVGIAINIVLLLLGLTKTLTVDLWNYWHIAFSGSLVYVVTKDFTLGLTTMAVHNILLLFFADLSAPVLDEYYGYANITFPHGTAAPGYIFALPLNWLFDRIPWFKDLKADPDTIQEKFGLFGDSAVMGAIIGAGIGILAKYSVGEIAGLAINMAGVMMLLPRMVALLMEGLIPLSEAANDFIQKRFPGRELYVGMDAALAVGEPAVLATALIMVPMTILLAVIVPGNEVLPFADLPTIPFVIALMVPVFKGNIIRSVVAASIYLAVGLRVATWVAPLFTQTAVDAGFDLAGASSISSFSDGAIYTTYIFPRAAQFGGIITWIILAVIGIGSIYGLWAVNRKK